MANTSDISIGLMHEVAKTGTSAGWESKDFSAIADSKRLMKKLLAVVRDEAEIIVKTVGEASEVVIEKTVRLLREVGKVVLPATAEKETKKSFIGDRYYYRAAELDRWLSKVQPAGKEGLSTIHQLEKQMTFREIAAAILGLDETSDLDLLASALIKNGHTVVLSQIESLIERTDADEATGLLTNGWGNFFFVVNKDGSVSVVRVYRDDVRQWYVLVHRFGSDARWGVVSRFFSRN